MDPLLKHPKVTPLPPKVQIARRYEISEDDPGGLPHATICLRTETATFYLNKST